MFVYDRESVVMKKWQILEFDGKAYYAFVPENDDPFDTGCTPEVESRSAPCFKEETVTGDYIYEDYSPENDASFSKYDESNDEEEQPELDETKPLLLNTSEGATRTKSLGNLYQVKIEASTVTLERLAEGVETDGEMQMPETMKQEPSTELSDYEMNETLEEDLEEEDFVEDSIVDNSMEDLIAEEREGEQEENEEDEADEQEEGEEVVTEEKTVQYRLQEPSKNFTATMTKMTGGPLKCKACSETFGSEMAFKKHVAWTHKKKVCIQEAGAYICSVCDYRTLKKSLFAAHLERKHETWTRKRQTSLVFPCETCGFICRSKHSLQSHFIRKHTDRFEHDCNFCAKKFKVKGDLTNHIRFHHKEKPISCDVCGKLCQNTGSLYVHQKWAHYKPKYECHICKRRMVTQENLDQHLITQHERREKIVCAQCGKTFTKKDSFRRHMAVHSGCKPHPCPICTKPFARQSQLRQHVLIHTGQRPFICDICGKGFTQKPGLICHRKTHPGPHAPLPVMPIADLVRDFIAQNEESQSHDLDLE